MERKAHWVSIGSVTGGGESLGELELGVSGFMVCLVSLEMEKARDDIGGSKDRCPRLF
jgi:hypothetical protein